MKVFQFVKIIRYSDGTPVDKPVWCLGVMHGGESVTACKHVVYGEYARDCSNSRIEYKIKVAARGVTCPSCNDVIRYYKSVKL